MKTSSLLIKGLNELMATLNAPSVTRTGRVQILGLIHGKSASDVTLKYTHTGRLVLKFLKKTKSVLKTKELNTLVTFVANVRLLVATVVKNWILPNPKEMATITECSIFNHLSFLTIKIFT